MSGKNSLIVIGIIMVVLILFVYHFSTPREHMHLAPVVGDNIEKSLPARDSGAKSPDSAARQ